MVTYTDNHDFQLYDQNETPWEHRSDFQKLDGLVPIVDTDANRTLYTAKLDSLFFSSDTGRVYRGDGASWVEIGVIGGTTDSGGTGTGGNPDTTYVAPGDEWVPIVEGAGTGDKVYFLPGHHKDTTHSDANEGPVLLASDGVEIIVPAGATVQARDGLNEYERFIRVIADDITIKGRGTLDGNAAMSDGMEGVGVGSTNPDALGHEHIIDLYDRHGTATPTNILIEGLTLQNAGGGDGVYLNDAHHVTIQNIHIDRAVRNGISVIDAEDVFINNFLIENTGGAEPQTGIAFEENGEGETMNRIMVSDGVTKNNARHGAYANNHFTDQVFGSASVENIIVQNVTAQGNGEHGFSWHGTTGGERMHFEGCHSVENGEAGFYIGGAGRIRLDNCSTLDNGQAGLNTAHESGVVCEADEAADHDTPAYVILNGYEAHSDKASQKHPGIAMAGSRLRVIDARIGSHTNSVDGFRSTEGSTVEHHLVDVLSGDAPAFTYDASTVTQL